MKTTSGVGGATSSSHTAQMYCECVTPPGVSDPTNTYPKLCK